MNKVRLGSVLAASGLLALASCKKENGGPKSYSATINVENVLNSKPLVESGTFQESGESPLIFPGNQSLFVFPLLKVKQ